MFSFQIDNFVCEASQWEKGVYQVEDNIHRLINNTISNIQKKNPLNSEGVGNLLTIFK